MNLIWSLVLMNLPIAHGQASLVMDTGEYNETMYWGTYRPNLYFGMRSRSTDSVLSGIIWHDITSLESQPWLSIFQLRRY